MNGALTILTNFRPKEHHKGTMKKLNPNTDFHSKVKITKKIRSKTCQGKKRELDQQVLYVENTFIVSFIVISFYSLIKMEKAKKNHKNLFFSYLKDESIFYCFFIFHSTLPFLKVDFFFYFSCLQMKRKLKFLFKQFFLFTFIFFLFSCDIASDLITT